MSYWQVEAHSARGAVVTFGLSAPVEEAAMGEALHMLPFEPRRILIKPVLPRSERARIE
jgi:hypothetical protein